MSTTHGISAATLLSKLDTAGKSIERTQDVALLEEIRGMTDAELAAIVKEQAKQV